MAKFYAISAVAAIVALGLIGWLIGRGGGDVSKNGRARATGETVKLVPIAELPAAVKELNYPIYWAGPRPGVEYEVTHSDFENRTWVRYLPKGTPARARKHFLTVSSIKLTRAFQSLHHVGQQPLAILVKLPGGGEAYAEHRHMTNAYLAFHGVGTEIEVYDPRPGKALRLIRSGAIVPIGSR